MTSKKDIIRQAEALLNDPHYPPTPEQQELSATILRRVKTVHPDEGGPPGGA